jgi:hypothetical protein
MTQTGTTAKKIYDGDASTTVFATTFMFLDVDDVTVVLRDTTDGTETEWTRGTQYTMDTADEGVAAGGDVTVKTTPTDYTPSATEELIIYRDRALTQPTNLTSGGNFSSESVETMCDAIVQMIQRLDDRINSILSLNEGANGGSVANFPKIYHGYGTPEGSVTAWRGSIYFREDGGASTTLYVKEGGDGNNTGWIAK